MLSAFNTKFKALQGKVPQSTMNTPWKRTLLFAVFLVGAIAVFLFIAISGLLKVIFGESGKPSDSFDSAEDARDEFGYKPGDIHYSKPGTGTNPILADLWEKSDETWYK